MRVKVIPVTCFNPKDLKEQAVRVLNWMKDFELLVTVDGNHFIDPGVRSGVKKIIKDNHLKCMLRKDVEASTKAIESVIAVVKIAATKLPNHEQLATKYITEVEVDKDQSW